MKFSSQEIVLTGLFSAIIAVLSPFTIPLGPVPLTLQTLIVGLAATLLGKKVGTMAVAIYLLMGFLGLPVLAGGGSGLVHYLGPTGGFLIGFLFQAYFTGWFLEKGTLSYLRSVVANLIGALLPLLFGALWLKVSAELSFTGALTAGVLPFLLPGLIKAVIAGYLGVLLGKRLPYTKAIYA